MVLQLRAPFFFKFGVLIARGHRRPAIRLEDLCSAGSKFVRKWKKLDAIWCHNDRAPRFDDVVAVFKVFKS